MRFLFKTYIYLILIFFSSYTFSQTHPQIDSAFAEKLKLKDDTTKVDELNDLAWYAVNNSILTSAYNIGNKSYEISKKINYTKGIAYSTKSIAATYFYRSDYDNALKYYEISYKAFDSTGDKKGISIALRNLGNIYFQIGNYKMAIDYYFKSLKLREELNDKKGIAAVYGAIGLVYMEQGKKGRKSALEYFNKSLAIENEIGNKQGMAEKYLYIGNIYTETYKEKRDSLLADTALEFFKKSKDISEEIDYTYNLATVEGALGLVYSLRGMYDKSYEFFKKSLELHQMMGDKYGVAGSYLSIGNYFKAIDKLAKAKEYYLLSNNLSKEINVSSIEAESSAELMKIFYAEKNYKKAIDYQRRHYQLKDSLQDKENTKKFTQLAMQFEFDKKEKLQELENRKKQELYKSELKRQKMTTYFFVGGFVFMLIFVFFVYRSYKAKQRANKLLEEKNIEINAQKEEIEQQRDYAITQTEIITEQHKHITDSIVYAQRIQQAVLPPAEYLDTLLEEYFVLYKPRDIVSGDYYWATKKGNKIIIAAADCTGHGVPGAFMSLLGNSFLNEIVNKIDTSGGKEVVASEILDDLRLAVKSSLRQTGRDTDAKDGMDMSLCAIDFKEMKMQYAGANNPIFIVRDNKLIKYSPDKMPVGIHYKLEKNFTNNIIDLKKNDVVYMFSDGYIDQFGGEAGRKFMIKRFGNLILELFHKPMSEQKELFDDVIVKWQNHSNMKGEKFKQIDDILVVGFKV